MTPWSSSGSVSTPDAETYEPYFVSIAGVTPPPDDVTTMTDGNLVALPVETLVPVDTNTFAPADLVTVNDEGMHGQSGGPSF